MSKLPAFTPPKIRQRLTFCKTSVFLIAGVTGLVITTDGTSCSSSWVSQLPSPPPLCHPPAQLRVYFRVKTGAVWGRLVSCIFQRTGIKRRGFLKRKSKIIQADPAYIRLWCLLCSLVKCCGGWRLPRDVHLSWLHCLPFISSQINSPLAPPDRCLQVCCPLPSHSPEGARAETPWEALAPGYQLDNNVSAVRQGGWELTAAGGLQMCGVLCWQLEGAAQTWLPKVTGLAETSFIAIFKEWAFWMQNLPPACASMLLQFYFYLAGLLLVAFSGCCRLQGGLKKNKSLNFCTCPGWLVASCLAVLIQSRISAEFLSTVTSADKAQQGVCSGAWECFPVAVACFLGC